ncbi:PEP-CTERM sorting domain-containing protein [Polymorphobacter arshaanensis]|uniref:PEP-CTERM sorting domain-containing protein n=1 Tax=Glacieibacterium arshaanense TaxID=2511025 RepID=A0A4Y9EMJ7_9SPHN|nr:PEPxxWA-CTERM sorting domain-containing protein [Polymorphobacter arshaanensis]TFU01395.1 PEP-CTERM sorting domain-containing protein [Polymorphobacter arshaanensis]
MKNALLASVLAATVFAAPASAVTLKFDNLPAWTSIDAAYHGFDFVNLYTLDTTQYEPSGYVNGVLSLNNVAYNGGGEAASISSITKFKLTSAYLTGAWNDGLTVQVKGFKNNALIYSQNFLVNTAGPVLVHFNHALVDTVIFSSSGGNASRYEGAGEHFVMDDLSINEDEAVVPEPSNWALMIVGFGVVGGTMRRRAGAGAA